MIGELSAIGRLRPVRRRYTCVLVRTLFVFYLSFRTWVLTGKAAFEALIIFGIAFSVFGIIEVCPRRFHFRNQKD